MRKKDKIKYIYIYKPHSKKGKKKGNMTLFYQFKSIWGGPATCGRPCILYEGFTNLITKKF